MSVVKVTEISVFSEERIESADHSVLAKVTRTVRDVCGAWIDNMNNIKVLTCPDGSIREWAVNLRFGFEFGGRCGGPR